MSQELNNMVILDTWFGLTSNEICRFITYLDNPKIISNHNIKYGVEITLNLCFGFKFYFSSLTITPNSTPKQCFILLTF